MTDKDLLKAAAKAAGMLILWEGEDRGTPLREDAYKPWNPLTDDGDSLRLAVKLRMNVFHAAISAYALDAEGDIEAREGHEQDPYAATRRAIVRAAAAMGSA